MVPIVSTAFAASKVVLSTPGKILDVAVTIASAGTTYIIALDATSAPADGSNVTAGAFGRVLAIVPVTTAGANEIRNLDFTTPGYPSDSGVHCAAGCVILLSSTAPTSVTGVVSGMWCNAGTGG